jgi:hypothetical protein
VRVTARVHPLFGDLLPASGFKRWDGVVLLVVELPDGSPGTIRADATDVFCAEPVQAAGLVLDGQGLRSLFALVTAMRGRRSSGAAQGGGK